MPNTKKSISKKVWEFSDKHPKFNKYFEIISDFFDGFLIINIVAMFIIIAIAVLVVYSNCPEEIREEASKITGAIISVIIVPSVINNINNHRKLLEKRCDSNRELYKILLDTITSLLRKTDYTDDDLKEVQTFIENNISLICIQFSNKVSMYLYYLYREVKNKNNESIDYFCRKIISEIRKEYQQSKSSDFPFVLFDSISQQNNEKDNKN